MPLLNVGGKMQRAIDLSIATFVKHESTRYRLTCACVLVGTCTVTRVLCAVYSYARAVCCVLCAVCCVLCAVCCVLCHAGWSYTLMGGRGCASTEGIGQLTMMATPESETWQKPLTLVLGQKTWMQNNAPTVDTAKKQMIRPLKTENTHRRARWHHL